MCSFLVSPEISNDSGETTTDRNIKMPVVTQQDELGGYLDVGDTSSTALNNNLVSNVHSVINMETFNMDNSLNRTYVLKSLNWTSAMASGAALGTVSLPGDLLALTYIKQKVNDFRLMRAAAKIFLRLTCNRTLYGRLVAAWQPIKTYTAVNSTTVRTVRNFASVFEATGSDHVLIDASASSVIEIDIPFVSPFRAWDLRTVTTAELGYLDIKVLDPLTDSQGQTVNATLTVSACFVDAVVYQPVDLVTTSGSGGFYSNVKNYATSFGKSVYRSVEAVHKSKSHAISKSLQAASDFAGTLENAPVIGGYSSALKHITGFGAQLAKVAGLDKPQTQDVCAITTVNENYSMNYGKGISTAPTLSFDPENRVSAVPNIFGKDCDEQDLVYISNTPSLTSHSVWVPSSTALQICSIGVDTTQNVCHFDILKQMHTWWSGSHKIKIYVTASIFHNVRMVFFFADQSGSDYNSCYYQIVEIQGSTEVELLLPYPYNTVMMPTVSTSPNLFGLYAQILAWSQESTSATTPIYLNLYKAAAEDVQFGGLRDMAYVCTSCPRSDFNKGFRPIHPSITGYSHEGLVLGDRITNIKDYMHCYRPDSTISAGGSTGRIIGFNGNGAMTTGTTMAGPELFGIFYRFWRGSWRFKSFGKQSNPGRFTSMYQDTTYNGNGPFQGISVQSEFNSTTECEIPYYDPAAFEQVANPCYYQRVINITAEANEFLCAAEGDDFTFGWLVLPPPGNIVVNPYAQGVQGLALFLIT